LKLFSVLYNCSVCSEAEWICVFSYSRFVSQSNKSREQTAPLNLSDLCIDLRLKSRHNFNQYATELISLIGFVACRYCVTNTK